MPQPQDRVRQADELLQGLLSEEEYVAAVHRIRRAVDPETLGEAVADLFHAGLPKIEAACRERFADERAVYALRDYLLEVGGRLSVGNCRRSLQVALDATRGEECERCKGSGKLQVECGPPGEEFVPMGCERCKGSGVELRQGCGEWISDPCPACEGTGKARKENGAPDA